MAVREVGYKKTPSKDGSFNPSLCRKVAQRLTRYCEKHGMPKEMLIELLMSRKED